MKSLILATFILLPSLAAAEGLPPPPGEPGRGEMGMRQDIQSWSGENAPDQEAMKQRREAFRKQSEERFKKSDADGNGRLSRAEVQQNNPRLAQNFDHIDLNKDGELSQEEIRQAFQQRMQRQQQQQKMQPPKMQPEERFKKSDADGNGRLSRAEVQQNNPRMAQNFDRIDQNKDGELSQEEIRLAFQQHAQGNPGRQQGARP